MTSEQRWKEIRNIWKHYNYFYKVVAFICISLFGLLVYLNKPHESNQTLIGSLTIIVFILIVNGLNQWYEKTRYKSDFLKLVDEATIKLASDIVEELSSSQLVIYSLRLRGKSFEEIANYFDQPIQEVYQKWRTIREITGEIIIGK